MQLPISTTATTLQKYLPHRPPMVWVDWVDAVSTDGGVCRVVNHPEAHYHGTDGIRWSAPIEWIAQSYGFVKAAQLATGLVDVEAIPKVTFLAQVRNAFTTAPLVGAEFFINVQLKRALGPMSLISGCVRNANGEKLASADLKLFAQ